MDERRQYDSYLNRRVLTIIHIHLLLAQRDAYEIQSDTQMRSHPRKKKKQICLSIYRLCRMVFVLSIKKYVHVPWSDKPIPRDNILVLNLLNFE